MRTVSIRLTDLEKASIPIGFVGENMHTQVRIDCLKLYEEYPYAAASLTVEPPKGDPYPAVVVRDGDVVVWDIQDSDLIYQGNGAIQLAFTVDDVIAKSYIGRTRISKSIIPTGEVPTPIENFIIEAGAALTAIPETINAALQEAKDSGEFDGAPGQDGHSPVVTASKVGYVTTISVDGEPIVTINDGVDGEDGHTPVLTATKSGTVTTIFVDGVQLAQINDGQDGQDGYSPTATVSKSGKKSTFTVTDKNGTTSVEILDGEDGSGGNIIDDNAGSGDTDKVWSADKTNTEISTVKSALSNKYEKPSGGIPSTDLADTYIAEPSSDGSNGQVLTTDGNGGRSWTTVSGGGGVTDVQVNGSSVVTSGVANVPVASSNALGVVKVDASFGINTTSNKLFIVNALSSQTKGGTNTYRPITPSNQHESVFFGLSKLAGEDLKNDTVTVGTYPEKSLSAISEMLNAPVSVSGSTPSITAKAGVQYKCGEVSTLTITVPASGIIDVVFESGSTPTVLTVTPTKTGVTAVKWVGADDPTALEANKTYEINILDGEYGVICSWT